MIPYGIQHRGLIKDNYTRGLHRLPLWGHSVFTKGVTMFWLFSMHRMCVGRAQELLPRASHVLGGGRERKGWAFTLTCGQADTGMWLS